MFHRSSLGLAILMAAASCVPPQSPGGAPHSLAQAPQPVRTARMGIAPGTILPAMPGMPLPPPPAPDAPELLEAAPAFVATAQSADDAGRALDCLTAAIYYEARSESVEGQRAVAQVVLNRVRNPAFPGSICGVVYQGSYRTTGCQFSFTCDGSLLRRREPDAWAEARQVAQQALAGSVYAPVGSAMYYHTTAVHPFWENSLTPVATIGAHIFYRWGGDLDNGFEFRQRYAGLEPASAGQSGWDDARQVLVRYGTTESAGVMVHRGGGELAAVPTATEDGSAAPAQPATLATVAGVTIHTGSGVATGGNAPGVRIHFGNGQSRSADAPAAPAPTPAPPPAVETAQVEAPAVPGATAPASSAAARD